MHCPESFFAALASHLHNIRIALVYTCIIPRVTISMFKIGFSQKGWTFSPRVVPDFFRHGSFCFGHFLILGDFADDRNTSALTQCLRNKKSNTQKDVMIAYSLPVAMLLAVLICCTKDEAQRLCEDWLIKQDRCYIN